MHIASYQHTNLNAVTKLYAHFVTTSAITFDLDPPSPEQMGEKLDELRQKGYPVFVALDDSQNLLGYAYASAYRPKHAYQHTSEVTIYVAPKMQGQGIGSALMQNLMTALSNSQFHLAIAMIADEAKASFKLHKKYQFEHVGYLPEVGHKFGKWHGVTILQRRV